MNILIIGTGYVGLNTGVVLAYLGNEVTCVDVNAEKIRQLKAGITPFYEPHLDELLPLVKENLRFTDDYAAAGIPPVVADQSDRPQSGGIYALLRRYHAGKGYEADGIQVGGSGHHRGDIF